MIRKIAAVVLIIFALLNGAIFVWNGELLNLFIMGLCVYWGTGYLLPERY